MASSLPKAPCPGPKAIGSLYFWGLVSWASFPKSQKAHVIEGRTKAKTIKKVQPAAAAYSYPSKLS